MSGLTLIVPSAYEVRIVSVSKDLVGRPVVVLEARQTINDPPGEWKRTKPLRVGYTLRLSLEHVSSGERP